MIKYRRGLRKAYQDLDVIQIVNSLEKVKCALASIVKNDKPILEETSKLFS
jgi:hypothetical protein